MRKNEENGGRREKKEKEREKGKTFRQRGGKGKE